MRSSTSVAPVTAVNSTTIGSPAGHDCPLQVAHPQVRTSDRRDIEPPSPDELTSQSRFNHTIKLVGRILHDALASLCTHRLSEWTRCKVQLFLGSDQPAIECQWLITE